MYLPCFTKKISISLVKVHNSKKLLDEKTGTMFQPFASKTKNCIDEEKSAEEKDDTVKNVSVKNVLERLT